MIHTIQYISIVILLLLLTSCKNEERSNETVSLWPSYNHDLSYIPFDPDLDNPNFEICDSASVRSGRNNFLYPDGNELLIEKIRNKFQSNSTYKNYTGFVVVRFLVNCKNETGRYRAQSMNLDFTKSDAPVRLMNDCINVIKGIKNWKKSNRYDQETEYMKYINLKFKNGKIEHVLL